VAVAAWPSSVAGRERDSIDRLSSWVNHVEWVTAALVGFLAVSLHLRFVTQVGGLWRDEANSVQVATMPTFAEMWHVLDYDSFPLLFLTVLRGWLGLFGADNDGALRVLGCIIGLGVLVALWSNARAFGYRWPVLSLALVGLNPMLIRYGDSTRAYGLGILLILLTFCSFWRLVNSPSPPSLKRVLVATLLALLSVQCLYYNSVLLFAVAVGAIAVALRTRAWRTVVMVLGICALAAASLLPYVPMMRRMHGWTFLVSHPVNLPWLWKRVCEVIGSPNPLEIWLWAGLIVAALGVVVCFPFARFRRSSTRGAKPDSQHDGATLVRRPLPAAVLFAAVALAMALPAYLGFLWALHYHTQPWYYITLAAFVACALDAVFGAWPATSKFQFPFLLRGLRIVGAVTLLGLAGLPAWKEMPTRQTNVDLLSAQLHFLTRKGDVILVSPWERAVTFQRYYHGPSEIVTIPPIEDHRFHRYDLVLREMMKADALRPLFLRLEEALRSGHRVFFAGRIPVPRAGAAVATVPPGYLDPKGRWHGSATFDEFWGLQVGNFLVSHAVRCIQIQAPLAARAVNDFENPDLGFLEGWRQPTRL
jgi:hypothetical protein